MISCSVSEVVKCPKVNAKVELTECKKCSYFFGYCENKKFYPRYNGYVNCSNVEAFDRIEKEENQKKEKRKKKKEKTKFYNVRLACDNCGEFTQIEVPWEMKVEEYLEANLEKVCLKCGRNLGPDWVSD